MTKEQEDWEARRESRQADNALREAIFDSYAAAARRERQGHAGPLLHENGETRRMTEHERRDCSRRIIWNEILDGRPLESFSALHLELLELMVAYWRELEDAEEAEINA